MYTTSDERVHLAVCTDYETEKVDAAVAACFNAFDMATELAGRKVVLKANLLGAYAPRKAVTTHPAVVAAAARYAYAAGASHVVIADSPGGVFNRQALENVYRQTGMAEAAKETGAALNFIVSGREGEKSGEFFLADYLAEGDVLINLAKLKTHTFARLTAAVKNNYGAIPGLVKARYHAKLPDRNSFAAMLCDLCDKVAPAFSLIDGIVGMEGKGPAGGEPKQAGVLIAAKNPHCADLAAAAVIGMDQKRIPTLTEARKRGYVPESAEGLFLSGAPLSEVKTRFEPPPFVRESSFMALIPVPLRTWILKVYDPYPVITDKCIGCGKCAESCPKQIIEIVAGKAVIAYKNCIQCFCCQEMCAPKAIMLQKLAPWSKIKRGAR